MIFLPVTVIAQVQRDVAVLKQWPAPLYFQPTRAESRELAKPETKPEALNALSSDVSSSLAATPAGSLVFVAMTPCRIADTRDAGFPAGFGPPTLSGNATRTFAIQSTTSLCPVPSIAQAYSFNVTVVPPGTTFPGNVNPSGALGYMTIWPTGVPQPVVSTLNSFLGTVAANAAIVPAGTGGSVNVFVFNNTDFILDINGYYAPQSGITLSQSSAAAPSLSFSGDPGTGISSPGTGTLNIATGGTNRLSVGSSGDVTATGNLNVAGNITTSNSIGIGNPPHNRLDVVDGATQIRFGASTLDEGGYLISTIPSQAVMSGGAKWNGLNWVAKSTAASIIDNDSGDIRFYTATGLTTGSTFTPSEVMRVTASGNVGIATNNPTSGRLQVDGGSGVGIFATSNTSIGVSGNSSSGYGVAGSSFSAYGVYGTTSTASSNSAGVAGNNSSNGTGVLGTSSGPGSDGVLGVTSGVNSYGVEGRNDIAFGVAGFSTSGTGVFGQSSSGYAGGFVGNVYVNGCLSASNLSCPSDARLKQDITPLSYGLPEVLRLRPVTWQWKDPTKTEPNLGLIAQDVEPVMPELVIQNADNKGSLGLNYMGLVPVTINAIQQQQAQIEDQQKRITEQQEQMAQQQEQNRKLEERLAALEKLLSRMQASATDQ
jgi:hypothetical protein